MKIFRWQYNLFILPALLVMVIFFVYPILLTLYFSFLDYSIIRHTNKFIGLAIYIKILKVIFLFKLLIILLYGL
uniref:Sugar ABC transporter permease n=1 Tax=Dictyoglomus thermophilum TaxID=14 RepID=A0A7C3MJK0_DICTH